MSVIETTTPRGNPARLHYREETSDLSVIFSTFSPWGGPPNDEYRTADYHPRTFLDIGGHIGSVTVAVLLDNPDCKAVIVEPLPENVAMIRNNLAENDLAGRATVIAGVLGPNGSVNVSYSEGTDRYIGQTTTPRAGAVKVKSKCFPCLLKPLGGQVDLVKFDCEGCERHALLDMAYADVGAYVGEFHSPEIREGLVNALSARYVLTLTGTKDDGTGNFWAVAK